MNKPASWQVAARLEDAALAVKAASQALDAAYSIWQQWREVARNRPAGELSVPKGAMLTLVGLTLIFGLCAALYAFMGVL